MAAVPTLATLSLLNTTLELCVGIAPTFPKINTGIPSFHTELVISDDPRPARRSAILNEDFSGPDDGGSKLFRNVP
jgi:hypothetical protein